METIWLQSNKTSIKSNIERKRRNIENSAHKERGLWSRGWPKQGCLGTEPGSVLC